MFHTRHECLCVFFAFCSIANAGVVCTVRGGVVPTMRAEAVTELTSDILMECTGGRRSLDPILTNLQLFLNTNITSRVLQGQNTEALLLVDEPRPNQQVVSPAGSPFNSAANVFQGTLQTANSLSWTGVPITPSDDGIARIIRLTNVRANASSIFSTTDSRSVIGYLSATGPEPVQIVNPEIVLGKVRSGLDFTVPMALSCADCVSPNPTMSSTTAAEPSFRIEYMEGFPSAFKTRTTSTTGTPANQNMPGERPINTESGFYNSSFPKQSGRRKSRHGGAGGFGNPLYCSIRQCSE
jgi:hypothetical protein